MEDHRCCNCSASCVAAQYIEKSKREDLSQLLAEAETAAKKLGWLKRFLARSCGRAIALPEEQRSWMSRPDTFYLFWCDGCEAFVKDLRHGRRRLYCPKCGKMFRM